MAEIQRSLGFNAAVFLYQIGLFLLLWFVMGRLFWKPTLAHLDSRKQYIADAYKKVTDTQHEMETLRTDYLARVAGIEADARARISAAIKEAQTERERLLAETRTQSDAAIKQGTEDMEREKNDALVQLRGRMVGMAVTAVGKALGPTANAAQVEKTIEEQIARGAVGGLNPARN